MTRSLPISGLQLFLDNYRPVLFQIAQYYHYQLEFVEFDKIIGFILSDLFHRIYSTEIKRGIKRVRKYFFQHILTLILKPLATNGQPSDQKNFKSNSLTKDTSIF